MEQGEKETETDAQRSEEEMIINAIHKTPMFTITAKKWNDKIEVMTHSPVKGAGTITHDLSVKDARQLKNALAAQIKNMKRRKK